MVYNILLYFLVMDLTTDAFFEVIFQNMSNSHLSGFCFSFYSVLLFLLFFIEYYSSLFVFHVNSNNFVSNFCQFLTYARNKYSKNCFPDLHREKCPRSSHRPHKFCWYFDREQYFPGPIEKTVIIV